MHICPACAGQLLPPPRTRCPDKRRLGVKESSRPQSAHARQPARWFAQAHAARDSLQPPLLPRHREHTPRTRPAARRGERFCRTSYLPRSPQAVGPGRMQPPLNRQVVIILRFLLHSIDPTFHDLLHALARRPWRGANAPPPAPAARSGDSDSWREHGLSGAPGRARRRTPARLFALAKEAVGDPASGAARAGGPDAARRIRRVTRRARSDGRRVSFPGLCSCVCNDAALCAALIAARIPRRRRVL